MPTILVEFEVENVDQAKMAMEQNADMLEHLTEEAKEHGARHHAFYTDGHALIALDDWDSEAGFHDFFDTNREVKSITEQAGVTKAPKVMVLTTMTVPGAF
jgi:hypothetical protein